MVYQLQTTGEIKMDLKNKVAFVTGAGSGIGKAAAIAFAKAGAKVAVLSDTRSEIESVAKEIGRDALALPADISEAPQVESAVRHLIDRFGRLDVVFANAGINGMSAPIDDLTPEEWDRTININLRGTFLTIRTTVPT
jgi:NAD(P)-dependent dehydrogenase (short-subunit alcohol dehydrogenase family)